MKGASLVGQSNEEEQAPCLQWKLKEKTSALEVYCITVDLSALRIFSLLEYSLNYSLLDVRSPSTYFCLVSTFHILLR